MPPPPACAKTGLKATWTWPPTKPSPVLHADDGSHSAAGVSPRALRCSIHQRAGLRHGRPARPSCGSSGRQVRIREPAPPVSVRCEPTQPSGAGRPAEPALRLTACRGRLRGNGGRSRFRHSGYLLPKGSGVHQSEAIPIRGVPADRRGDRVRERRERSPRAFVVPRRPPGGGGRLITCAGMRLHANRRSKWESLLNGRRT